MLFAISNPSRGMCAAAPGQCANPFRSHWRSERFDRAITLARRRGLRRRSHPRRRRYIHPHPRKRLLLDALEDNDIRPEAACRSGECSPCRVRIIVANGLLRPGAHLAGACPDTSVY
ncbi:2Fe-2S iron-sulfur cluster-binding protein [Nocardia sp. NPDC057455]|uniref:2Fe-2S iron-sulfur cluster-binding protein n=1 Tax=Nocardia sp. NPDC057455 TaxID=3346138 RepID=UPI00366D9C47